MGRGVAGSVPLTKARIDTAQRLQATGGYGQVYRSQVRDPLVLAPRVLSRFPQFDCPTAPEERERCERSYRPAPDHKDFTLSILGHGARGARDARVCSDVASIDDDVFGAMTS